MIFWTVQGEKPRGNHEGSGRFRQKVGIINTVCNRWYQYFRAPGAGRLLCAFPLLWLCAGLNLLATPARAQAPTYLKKPPEATPMAGLMPVRGTSSPVGLLQINSTALQRQYNADPVTGKVEIVEYLILGNDSTQL
jgi:hypothetical protein